MGAFQKIGLAFLAIVFSVLVALPFLVFGDHLELGKYQEAVGFTWGLMFYALLGFPLLSQGKPSSEEFVLRVLLGVTLIFFVGAVNFIPDQLPQRDVLVKSQTPDGATYASWQTADRRVGFEWKVGSADQTVVLFPRTIYPGRMLEVTYRSVEDRLCSTVKSGSDRFTECIQGGWWSSVPSITEQRLAWFFPPEVEGARLEGMRRIGKLAL